MIGPLGSPRLRPPSALHCVALTHARALDQSVRLQALKERTKASNYRRRFGYRAFAVAAPRVWNSLPTDIKLHRSTTTSFKRRLKTVSFNRGFAEYNYVNDSVMHYRSFSRKRNINTSATVTVTVATRFSVCG